MTGLGIARGLLVTLQHFVMTFVPDLKRFPRRYRSDAKSVRQGASERGAFTVQYPEERLQVWERFRSHPQLVFEAATGEARCTACGICARACPPQCIWIVRAKGPDGRPRPQPEQFHIDISICMCCGSCAEFCPFDAIKMGHQFEVSAYERLETFLYDKQKLRISTDEYAKTHPVAAAEEEQARQQKAAAKAAR
jgi:NADH-quinone oxidoreductase subunit I